MTARIVSEEPGVDGVARRVLGVGRPGAVPERTAQVEARLAGDVVTLRVRLSVTYPTPVHAVTERLRRRLIDRIGELTGKKVGLVEIVVAALQRPQTGERVVR
ncbi:MAG TPA: Asp23/Gls24 family envelope stress response protein [Pseudonocardiaceae bacterium]|nr:Asp23/Gls24 family envelope stress response protein [Pseudonocardiaceae bacterium]